ncbi:MAG TPA: ROK family protein [Gemmatimonadaceae bacterium]|nr:ROK family protein [Gemmatimonadaceae bacterium]
MSVLAIDLGGTKLASAIFSAAGELRVRETVPIDGRRGGAVGALIVEHARGMRDGATNDPIAAIGVCIPGIYRAERGTVWAPNIPEWDDYPLRDELRECVGGGLPVMIDSDRAAYVLGESWRGVARDSRNVAFVAVGTGIGAGLLVDGRVLRGHADIAGAIGWLALRQPFRESYASCGCFEHHASGPGLVKVARERLAGDASYAGVLRAKDAGALTPQDLFAAHEAGDPLACAVLDDAIAMWGMVAANLVSLFNPEMLVFGGGVFGPAARFLDRIHDEALRWAQPISIRQATFATSMLGGDAGLYGAAKLAVDGLAR